MNRSVSAIDRSPSLPLSTFTLNTTPSMDFSRFNQAEQAQIAAMIEHKQVRQTISTFLYQSFL